VGRYFYAGGRRHPLVLADDQVAIDSRAAAAAGLGEVATSLPVASQLASGVAIVQRSAVPAALRDRLEAAGALRSVYRSGDVLVVPLPEVRLEFEPGSRAATLRALASSNVPADITLDEPDRVSLRPRSGRAEDALDLANHVVEQGHAGSASVRMLQVVPRRDVTRPARDDAGREPA
jgi:hypothetical protein